MCNSRNPCGILFLELKTRKKIIMGLYVFVIELLFHLMGLMDLQVGLGVVVTLYSNKYFLRQISVFDAHFRVMATTKLLNIPVFNRNS